MTRLHPDETELVGEWEFIDGRVKTNAAADRIQALLASGSLERVATANEGWSTLYRDSADGRLWELTYPQSELHGGGPPVLRWVTAEEIRDRYADHVK